MSEPTGDQPKMSFWSLAVRNVIGLGVGAIPGALIADLASRRTGIAVILLGMPIGLIIAFGIAAPGRLARLLLAVLVARNIPIMHHSALEWVDDGSAPNEKSSTASDRLERWLIADGVHKPNTRCVLGGLIIGIIGGGLLMARDMALIQAGITEHTF